MAALTAGSPSVDGTTPGKSPGAPGGEKRRFVTGGKASFRSVFCGRYGGFKSADPSITKDGKSSGSLRGTRKPASRSNKTSLKTKGRVSNVAGTEADAGIPRRADNECRVNRRQSWAPRPDLWGDLSAGAPPRHSLGVQARLPAVSLSFPLSVSLSLSLVNTRTHTHTHTHTGYFFLFLVL